MVFDGFNERSTYIHNSVDRNAPCKPFDNSFAKMRSEERRGEVVTASNDHVEVLPEVRGQRSNFLIRNNNMNMANKKPPMDNPVSRALQSNMFKH